MSEKDEPKYRHIEVQLTDGDDNVFAVIGRVTRAMRRAGCAEDEVKAMSASLLSQRSYDAVLNHIMHHFDVS